MLAKAILPWFGGVANAWIVAMLFFQGMLLFGYGYAYLIARFLPSKAQPVCHVALLLASAALMPIGPSRAWLGGAQDDPSLGILRILFLSVGLPYFLLSTTGPLIQAWYAQSHRIAFPYRLFALSNLGSLAALLAYPSTLEPFLSTRRQMVVWSTMYGAFVILCGVAAAAFWRSHPKASEPVAVEKDKPSASPGWRNYLLWGALAAGGSALLVSVMNHLCQNVAPIPLLWVLPLGVYLLTFILSFDRQGWYRPMILRLLLPVALGVMMYGIFYPAWLPGATWQIPLYLACLFCGCMFCHGELARRKPHSQHLTGYYLMLALGGAVASLAIGLVAPRVSNWQVEFPETLAGVGLLALFTLYPKHWSRRVAGAALIVVLVLLATGVVRARKHGSILQARSFYGALSVVDNAEAKMRVLGHGWIQHGTQFLVPQLQTVPTAYYGPQSGAGLLLRTRKSAWDVGMVGLGAGTLAAYGRSAADSFTFYEIDPLVYEVAQSKFTYLKMSRATVKTVIGDGRLSLEKEPNQRFNMLVVDAFSGDSIPTHLLTREAFQLYFAKLKSDGAIAIHISNGYVDLMPVLGAIAADLHKEAILVQSYLNGTPGAYDAVWVLIGDPSAFRDLPRATVQPLPPLPPGFEVWTDDYSNVLQLLK